MGDGLGYLESVRLVGLTVVFGILGLGAQGATGRLVLKGAPPSASANRWQHPSDSVCS